MLARRTFILAAAAALVLGGCDDPKQAAPGGGEGAPAPADKVLKLAAVLPLTGANASLGQEVANAARLAVDDWNAAGQIKGYKLEFVAEDDASDPKQAVAAAQRVAADPAVVAVVAHFNSGCLLPASNIYHGAHLMAITPAATNPEITNQGFPEIGRVTSHDGVQGKAVGMFIQKKGWKKVAIIHDKTQYGAGLAEVVEKSVKDSGLSVVGVNGLTVGEKDFKTLLTTVKATSPDVIFFGGLADEAGFLVRQMKELGMNVPFFSDDGVYGKDFLEAAGPASEGAYVSFPSRPFSELKDADRFFKNYEAKYGTPVQNWGPYGYDAANLLLLGVMYATQDPGPAELRQKVVANIRKGDFKGVLGSIKLDEKGDPVDQSFSIYQIQNGQFVYLETVSAGETPG